MKIDSSQVNMTGNSSSYKKVSAKQTYATIRSASRLDLTEEEATKRIEDLDVDSLWTASYTKEGKYLLSSQKSWNAADNRNAGSFQNRGSVFGAATGGVGNGYQKQIRSKQALEMEIMEKIISILRGKHTRISLLSDLWSDKNFGGFSEGVQTMSEAGARAESLQYLTTIEKFSYESYESASMSFDSSIFVKTADGRSIEVNLSLQVSHELYQKFDRFSLTESLQALCDPLVINFGVDSASLGDIKFSFDLDCDGTPDQISMLAQGSGFLALDKNGDGVINDGSELFGALSGNGFYDLAQYDADGNGWIDENDPIFDSLRIWTKDSQGNDVLLALGEVGIGAIYLGYAETEYALNDENGQLNGMIRKTGIYLKEDGSMGTVQHVDLAI